MCCISWCFLEGSSRCKNLVLTWLWKPRGLDSLSWSERHRGVLKGAQAPVSKSLSQCQNEYMWPEMSRAHDHRQSLQGGEWKRAMKIVEWVSFGKSWLFDLDFWEKNLYHKDSPPRMPSDKLEAFLFLSLIFKLSLQKPLFPSVSSHLSPICQVVFEIWHGTLTPNMSSCFLQVLLNPD